jgi:hypothetical protein
MNGRRNSIVGVVVGLLVLVTAGFAAAAIASGSSLGDILPGTTATTGTTGATDTTESTVTSSGLGQRKVLICHHTHSAKHPWVTITVGAPAVPAHLRHGDSLGACTSAQLSVSAPHGHKGNAGATGNSTSQGSGKGSGGQQHGHKGKSTGAKGHQDSTSHGSGKGSGGQHGHNGNAGAKSQHSSHPHGAGGGSQGNGNGSGHGNSGGHGGGKP